MQIRQSWDQGSLLKQLDVIGKTGRNWPIRDSKEHIGLIARCVKREAASSASENLPVRSRGNSTNALRDPHASLTLFAPREEVETAAASVVSPYAGNRPRQRSFTEILGDEPEEDGTSPTRGRDRSQSPSKSAKIGAGKNFQPIRLFEAAVEEPEPDTPEGSPEKFMRPNPKKYEHFDFVDGSDPHDAPKPGRDLNEKSKTKHDTTWSFDDFATPQKPTASRVMHKARDVRHWGPEDDVVEETPDRHVAQVKPRRDAEAHFEFLDDGPASAEPRMIGRPRGTAHNSGLGLYENNLYNEDGSAPTPGPPPLNNTNLGGRHKDFDAHFAVTDVPSASPNPPPLGNITNLGGRHKDFDPHFNVTDGSPNNGNGAKQAPAAKMSDDRMKAVRMMESNWLGYDESPAQKENSNPNQPKAADERGISIGGDGMGGKKGTNRDWLFGDNLDEAQPKNVPGKQRKAAELSDDFWDF